MERRKLMLIGGNASQDLANAIAEYLNVEPTHAQIDSFGDGETRVKIKEDVRGEDVFLIQTTGEPTNHNYMELLITIDALRRASAGRITAVVPYYGYARQDRKDQPRVPITAKLMANLLTAAGANRVVTLDLHAHQIQGFFDIPLDHLYAVNIFVEHLKNKVEDPVIVSPDSGGVKMAHGFAKRMNCDLAIIDKRRIDDKNTKAMNVVGDVEGKNAIIVDDIIASGSSLVEAAQALKDHGAKDIYAAITHGVLSGPATERISKSIIKELAITDSIQLPKHKESDKITVLSTAELLGEAIKRVHNADSVSSLFDN